MTKYVATVLLLDLALAVPLQAGEAGWKTGRITTVRVLERAEVSDSVTPPVQEDGGRRSGASYGAIAYVVLQSGENIYNAQYAGTHLRSLEQLRNRTVQFRIEGSKLYLKRAASQPLELQLLPSKRLLDKTEMPQK
jgi:hypothetical protein